MSDAPPSPAEWAPLAARIARWLPAARWFGGKGARPEAVAIHDAAPLPGGLVLALVDVAGADGAAVTRWVVPVDAASGDDAGHDDRFAAWVLAAAASAPLRGARGRFVGRAIADGPARPAAPVSCRATPLGGDASNTSLRVDTTDGHGGRGTTVLKLLRRALDGEHPEVEVGRFLAESTGWQGTPRLLSFLRYEPEEGRAAEPTTIATLHAFAPGCDSAWAHGLSLAAAARGPVATAIAPVAARLGRVTAEMHAALASRPDIPAFAPRAATPATRRALAERLIARAHAVLERLARAHAPPDLRTRLGRLAAARSDVVRVLSGAARAGTTAADIRVHGDYHLGQVLVDAAGATLLPIDFEGEPARPLSERREPSSAAKDVAGMCRSFDYLLRQAASALGRAPEDPAVPVGAFLDGYRDVARGAVWWPAERAEERALVAAFVLDKALYELAYELDNRPDWVTVPLGALETLLAIGD